MTEMREAKVKCLSAAGFHHMAYVEWGDVANPKVLVCVHGLTRQGRDFDTLAEREREGVNVGEAGLDLDTLAEREKDGDREPVTLKPRVAEVYNMGGSRHSNCSMLEAIDLCEQISGKKLAWTYVEDNRIGDHIWYISDVRKFQQHYPDWRYKFDLKAILEQIHGAVIAG